MTGRRHSGFADRTALVTGGASGIGREVAAQLAARGASVALADINAEGAEREAARLAEEGLRAFAVAGDVSRPDQAEVIAARTVARFGGLDILIHSAGIGVERAFLDTTPEEWQRIIDIDLSGTFYMCQAAARRMMERGYGRIVTLSSVAGLRGGTGRAAYGAAKGGVVALTKVMAVELAPFGITANALAPGAIETELVKRMHAAETRKVYRAGVPLDRYGDPEEVAAAALFLASEEASYMNGHVLAVDGGFLAAGIMHRRAAETEGAKE